MQKTMQPENFVVVVADIVVASKGTFDDMGSLASVIATPGVLLDPLETPCGSHCYCSSCLDTVAYDSCLPFPGVYKEFQRPLLLLRDPPLNLAWLDAPGF